MLNLNISHKFHIQNEPASKLFISFLENWHHDVMTLWVHESKCFLYTLCHSSYQIDPVKYPEQKRSKMADPGKNIVSCEIQFWYFLDPVYFFFVETDSGSFFQYKNCWTSGNMVDPLEIQ